jgi:hypothetical protein
MVVRVQVDAVVMAHLQHSWVVVVTHLLAVEVVLAGHLGQLEEQVAEVEVLEHPRVKMVVQILAAAVVGLALTELSLALLFMAETVAQVVLSFATRKVRWTNGALG